MYSFTFGTYDGLFVECETPAVLPRDLSYFDLRRSERRAIPKDNTPNVLIRKIESDTFENAGDIILIALVYKALEGSRDGFVGFGCIIVGGISQANVTEALRKSIVLANQSGDYFSNGRLLSRPNTISETPIDLRQLPLSGRVSCFGKVQTSLNEKGTIEQIGDATEYLFQKLNSFELILNENNGLHINEIADFLQDQVNKQEAVQRQKELQKAKLENEEKLAQFARDERQNRLLIYIVYGASAIAFIGLLVLLIFWLNYDSFGQKPEEITAQKQELTNQITISDRQVAEEEVEQLPGQVNLKSCFYETTETEILEWAFVSLDLPVKVFSENPDKCLEISAETNLYIDNNPFNKPPLKKVLRASNDDFLKTKELLKGEYRLTSFQRFLDAVLNSDKNSVFLNSNSEDTPQLNLNYTFAFSFGNEAPEILSCSNGALEPTKDDFKLYYFTESSGAFESIVQSLSASYKVQLIKTFEHLKENLSTKLTFEFNQVRYEKLKMSEFIRKLRRSEVKRFDPKTPMSESFCVLTFSEQDFKILDELNGWRKGNTISDTFKLLGRVAGLKSEINDAGHFLNLPTRYPSCNSLPEYVLAFQNEREDKGILRLEGLSLNFNTEKNNITFTGVRERFPPKQLPLDENLFTRLRDITKNHGQKLVTESEGSYEEFCAQK